MRNEGKAGQQPAQHKRITGVVADEEGEPLPGASILIKGSTRGVMTDVDGTFSIDVDPEETLEISYLGYETMAIPVGEQTYISVKLQPLSSELDEVTVVAFGTQKKASVVAAIETVKVKDLKIVGSNLTTAFAGRIPGVISYQTTGEPGADNAQFFVRGVTTMNMTSSNSLILIDGFEASSTDLARTQPDDIESFSVLKDASAAALYGARGANGVILVNTKVGLECKPKINVRVDMNVSSPTALPELVDGVTYMNLYNEAVYTRRAWTGGLAADYYSAQKIQGTMEGKYPMLYPNVDWYDELFNRQTYNAKANINISGGDKAATYYVAGGYDKGTGLLKVPAQSNFNNNIDINRFHLRTNVVFKLGGNTKLDARISGRFTRTNSPNVPAGDIFASVMNGNPVAYPAVWEPDAANQYTRHILFGFAPNAPRNPYMDMVSGYATSNDNTLSAQATLMHDADWLLKGLKAQLKGSVNIWNYYSAAQAYNPYYYAMETSNPLNGDYTLYCVNSSNPHDKLGDAVIGRDGSSHYYFEARLNWEKQFGKHNVNVMTVGMIEEKTLDGGGGSIFYTLPERNVGNSGRISYGYDDRYFVEFDYGYNGSEKFAAKRRFGFFPTIGGAWLPSNEPFYGEGLKKIMPMLKFKFTYGLVGNDAIAGREGRFFFLSRIALGGGGSAIWGKNTEQPVNGYSISQYANPDLGWEIAHKTDVGVEVSFLKDEALKIQVDVFRDMRKGVYMPRVSLPVTAGFRGTIAGNVGEVKSQGLEFSIDLKHFFNPDTWLTGRANFTYAANEYLKLDEPNYPYNYMSRVGSNVNQPWGYVAERLFIDDEEILYSPKQNDEVMAGDIKYTDVNGDGVIDDNDRIAISYPTVPEIQYGFGLSGGWKKFDLSFFFQGSARSSFFINPEGIAPLIGGRNALKFIADDYWTETDPDPYSFWPRLSTANSDNNTMQSTWWLRDGAFLRLKSVEAGYNLPLEKYHIGNCRLYLSGENLFLISAFKLWYPEMGSNGLAYPINRRINVGIQLQF